MDVPTWLWIAFWVSLVAMLAVDLFVHRGDRADSKKTAVVWTIVWIAVGVAFGGIVWVVFGSDHARDYYGAYLIEKSLSADNLFVFLIIFQTLEIPKEQQHKPLFWGIFGALVFRALFVWLGASALHQWQWLEFVFAVILIYAAWRAFREDPDEEKENRLVKWLSKHLPITKKTEHKEFFTKENGKRVATPLLIAVVGLELSDIMFAIDSVPAALSITREPFLVYTSNAFAILGLRSLYLVLAQTIAHLRYLHYGLAFVLLFAGVKIGLSRWWEIPPLLSIAIIVVAVGAAVVASLLRRGSEDDEERGLRRSEA